MAIYLTVEKWTQEVSKHKKITLFREGMGVLDLFYNKSLERCPISSTQVSTGYWEKRTNHS